MDARLHYSLAQQRVADLQRGAERERLANAVITERRKARLSPISRLGAHLTRLTFGLASTGL